MAIYVTIDTSAGIEIGVVSKSAGVLKVLAFLTSADTRHHAENLTPMVKEALSVADARRKELYALRARAMGPDDLEILSEAEVIAPELLAQKLDDAPAVVVKHQADESLYRDLGHDEQIVTVSPDVWVRLLLSRQSRCDAGESVDLSSEPLYLRRPDVHAGAHAQPHAQGNPYEHKA